MSMGTIMPGSNKCISMVLYVYVFKELLARRQEANLNIAAPTR